MGPRVAAVLLFGGLLLLPALGELGAVDSTDARYLAIGREMWARSDWLVPRLGGAPHLDKPPFAYWAAALGYTVFGPTEFGGRFAQQLATIGTALVVLFAARRLAGERWALPAALVFLTTGLPFATSRGLATDHFQLLLVCAALLALLEAARRQSAARAAWAGALLGASMLVKGPIALMVAAAVWLAFAACVRGRARLPARGVALGAAIFVAIGLPWYTVIVHRNPAILDWFLEVQLASRVTGTDRGHLKDAAYYARAWPTGLLPWTALVALAAFREWPRGRWRDADPTPVFLLCWAIVPVLLFSLFPTKLETYILPAFPAAALLVAHAGARGRLDDRAGRLALTATAIGVAAIALALGTALCGEAGLGADLLPWVGVPGTAGAIAAGAGLAATGAATFALAWRARAWPAARSVPAIALATGLALLLADLALAPAFPTLREVGRLAASVPGARLVEFSLKPSLFFYADAEGGVSLATVNGVVDAFVDPAEARRMTLTRDDALAILRAEPPAFALIDAGEPAAALARDGGLAEVARAKRFVLLANPAAQRALAARPGGNP